MMGYVVKQVKKKWVITDKMIWGFYFGILGSIITVTGSRGRAVALKAIVVLKQIEISALGRKD